MTSRVVISQAAVRSFVASPQSPVSRMLLADGREIERLARQKVGIHRPTPGERRTRAPGTLLRSIRSRVERQTSGIRLIVEATDPIAFLHHEGTRPHVIRPKPGTPRLVFFSQKAGQVVYARVVHHPGTKPNRFLRDAMIEFYRTQNARHLN